jgi:hypothetical protein
MKTVTNLKWIRLLAWAAVGILIISSPAMALTNYIFFSDHGDTSATSMVQGDTIFWGANCEVGATVNWELWIDINSNALIDSSIDVHIISFDCIDGETHNDHGLPDINPSPDGWVITPPLLLGIAPASYVFRATDQTDGTSALKGVTCIALPSPPNQFLGQITVQGHPAPDIILKNVWIEAKLQTDDSQMWTALTNVNGQFTINIGSAGTGLDFQITPYDIPGYVKSSSLMRVASGIVDSVNFIYSSPTDSLWGAIVDNHGNFITRPVSVYVSPRNGGQGRDYQATNGTYCIYFAPSEFGQWNAGLNSSDIVPDYLCPSNFNFDNSIYHSQNHDFYCVISDTLMYARVTENHNPPSHQYCIQAQSNDLNCWTEAISGVGNENLVTLHISSQDISNWGVNIANWNNQYPIPPGYVLEGGEYWNRHPGDTVTLNLISGILVQDTVKLDPGDPPINMNSVWINLQKNNTSFGAQPDQNGVFRIYADTGTYIMNLNCPGYLNSPQFRWVNVSNDTIGGLGFDVKYPHCIIRGTMTGVTLPLPVLPAIYAYTDTGSLGYFNMVLVDVNTGTFSLPVCDGNWHIPPPFLDNYIMPDPINLTILESPDTLRSIEFVYLNPQSVENPVNTIPDKFVIFQNNPNPFNAQTSIDYGVPMTSNVKIEVYDLLGRKLETLRDGEQQAGYYKVIWNAGNRPSGIYFYSLKVGDFSQTRKMLLLK